MPKTRRDRSVSSEKSRRSPLHCSSLSSESNPIDPQATADDIKEWEDVRCPVCMEHPHNAVLLICSSYHKGCRPYMCDTSHRHSNCLDQFRKSFTETSTETLGEENPPPESSAEVVAVEALLATAHDDRKSQESSTLASGLLSSMHKVQQKLVCPLCRGQVSGWVVVDLARDFMNSKSRSCACETCEFIGTYSNLRKHARSEHPKERPSEADPDRQRSWRDLERERDIGDLLSTIQSSFGDDQDDDAIPPMDDGSFIALFFLWVWQPSTSPGSSSSTSRNRVSRAQTRAQTGATSVRLLRRESNEAEPSFISGMDGESSGLQDRYLDYLPGSSGRRSSTSRPGATRRSSTSRTGATRRSSTSRTGATRRSSRLLWGESNEAEPRSNYESSGRRPSSPTMEGTTTWRRRVRRRLSTPDDEI